MGLEMDGKTVKMLSKELQAYKKKGTTSDEPAVKKARVNTPSSIASVDAAATTKVAAATRVGAIIEGSMPPSSMSPPTEDPALRPLAGREEGEKKKEKKIIVKVHCKAHLDGSNDDNNNSREDPFDNPKLIRDLTNRFAMPEVVDQIADLDHMQLIWNLLGSFLKNPSSDHSQGRSSPTDAELLSKGIPLRSIDKGLKREIHHLKKKLKKMEDELQRSRKNASKAIIEVTCLCKLHMKDSVSFNIKKGNFERELAKLKKSINDKSWALTMKVSFLEVELKMMK
ncbi:hypothetical protein COCNU_03G003030 [Cocos nucifera]|uniref:Uncharacterized protein n=1 Tax=Cocos nucifera TaxID=13894 RepID=A0A8K0MYA5_COCNU|nr:hypothetical protein COCNU_03G003030 [Cocos nucifera]